MLRIILLAALVVVLPFAGAYAGDTTADATADSKQKQRALDLFERGSEAFSAGKYKDAVDLFLAGDKVLANGAFAYNIGLAYKEMGDHAQALRWLREFVRREKNPAERDNATGEISALERHLRGKGVQQVTVLSTPTGAMVLIGGQAVGVSPWTGELKPGTHTVVLRLRDHEDEHTQFTLSPDHAMDVGVTLKKTNNKDAVTAADVPQPTAAAVRAASDARAGPSTTLTVLGIGALGVGVGLLATSAGFEAARAGAEDETRNAETQLEAGESFETMKGHRLTARVLVGVGAALAITGGAMLTVNLLRGDPSDDDVSAAAHYAPRLRTSCGPYGCHLQLTGTF